MNPEQAFGRVLRTLREERGLTQEALALQSGYHATYISQLERGMQSPSLGTLYRLARTLTISPSEFLLRSEAAVDELPDRPPQNRPRKAE
jgi:transcriptional regulator with XRE-family HTH domain